MLLFSLQKFIGFSRSRCVAPIHCQGPQCGVVLQKLDHQFEVLQAADVVNTSVGPGNIQAAFLECPEASNGAQETIKSVPFCAQETIKKHPPTRGPGNDEKTMDSPQLRSGNDKKRTAVESMKQ